MESVAPMTNALRPEDVELLLGKLCVDLGFCLDWQQYDELCEKPPDNVVSFVDAVFVAQRMEPAVADRALYRRVQDYVEEAFQTAQAKADSESLR